MVHRINVCVCVCVTTKKFDKNNGACCEKERVITTKSSYNVQTTILYMNYTENKSSIKANMCKHSLAANKKYLIVYSLRYSNAKQEPKITIVQRL